MALSHLTEDLAALPQIRVQIGDRPKLHRALADAAARMVTFTRLLAGAPPKRCRAGRPAR